jgi:transposase
LAFGSLEKVVPRRSRVSSGHTDRNRLHRGGDRDANSALWPIALRPHVLPSARQDYVARRTAERRTKKEILRCLKRHIAREAYPLLPASPAARGL